MTNLGSATRFTGDGGWVFVSILDPPRLIIFDPQKIRCVYALRSALNKNVENIQILMKKKQLYCIHLYFLLTLVFLLPARCGLGFWFSWSEWLSSFFSFSWEVPFCSTWWFPFCSPFETPFVSGFNGLKIINKRARKIKFD